MRSRRKGSSQDLVVRDTISLSQWHARSFDLSPPECRKRSQNSCTVKKDPWKKIDESSQSESKDELNDSFANDHEFDIDYENYSSSTNEEEDNLNASRGRKRMRLLTDSEGDSEESTVRQNIEIAIDGTAWKKIETSSSPGISYLHPDSFGD
ncbi:hypothetical protein AVEN_269574-1 [Araneus ventricosus]|uniref:Uncharacterized protein n=1 Tax=Araneus ventricosus TaxID=182803 RepID=A0A4Y2CC97_ARAVE|nr:hypothetical protein AVEN_269574-1 [Araneus ventricosus]